MTYNVRSCVAERTSAEELAAKKGQAITVRRYSTKWMERVAEHLTITGESAIDRITTEPGRQLHAGARGLHGYVRNGDAFRTLTSAALVAADCFRSTSTRVRSVELMHC